MTNTPATYEPDAPQPMPSLSPWSIISLALLGLSLTSAVEGGWILVGNFAAPADTIVRTFLGLGSLAAGWWCALFGALCGWAGVRNATVRTRVGRVAVGLNAAVVVLGFCLASLLLHPR